MNPTVSSPRDLYSPILAELGAVREIFDEELRCDLPFVEQLCEHIRHYRGKMIRPALLLLSGKACGETTREHLILAAVLEMVHMATLVHDDVLDEAEMRRNRATVNAMNSNETAVLLGDYLISHAYHLCSSLDSQAASRAIASCTNTVCEGELLQVANRDNWNMPVELYLTIIARKTAALTSVAGMLGARCARAPADVVEALQSYGMDVGMAFQIVDDVLDVTGSEKQVGKTLGLDAARGKLTLPMIYFMDGARNGQRELLQQACSDVTPQGRQRLAELLGDGIERALAVAAERVQSAIASLQILPPSPARDSLTDMAEFILQRRF